MTITKIKEPFFHVTGERGWINDPNGLIYYKGQYHAFFQYYPNDTKWGPMHWGHAVSPDMIHWEEKDLVLFPITHHAFNTIINFHNFVFFAMNY